MRKPSWALAALLFLASSMLMAADYGPAIGSKMPDFEAAGQDGQIHSLKSLLGSNGAVILFFRSADW